MAAEVRGNAPVVRSQFLDISRQAGAAAEFVKLFAHESRLLLLCLLAEREYSVTELESILGLRQPTISQQLARLRLENMVKTRRDGKAIYYSLADERARPLIDVLCATFGDSEPRHKVA